MKRNRVIVFAVLVSVCLAGMVAQANPLPPPKRPGFLLSTYGLVSAVSVIVLGGALLVKIRRKRGS